MNVLKKNHFGRGLNYPIALESHNLLSDPVTFPSDHAALVTSFLLN